MWFVLQPQQQRQLKQYKNNNSSNDNKQGDTQMYNIRCLHDTLYARTAETSIKYCIIHNLENAEIRSVLNLIMQ